MWDAVLFIPKVDVRAKELSVGLDYISGTKLVNLGIYSNNEFTGSVGDPLPGGQGSTSRIPDEPTCCQLTKVVLPGDGVLLTAGTIYWLVASPDNVNAPTFSGAWHLSDRAVNAQLVAGFSWDTNPGRWLAAQIRGTKVQAVAPGTGTPVKHPVENAQAGKVLIFNNLGRTSDDRYFAGLGIEVRGNNVPPLPEVWSALPFIPRANVHATTLSAAVGYLSRTKKVNLGIYSDNAGVPGTLLPGGQASTTKIPDSGVCCQLAKVNLPGTGVSLTKGVQYWLVASADDLEAPDFNGVWQETKLAEVAYQQPENFFTWTSVEGGWSAARIEGTSP